MANTLLNAISSSDWTETQLRAFNIQVDTVDALTFFNTTQLPDAHVSPVILATEKRPQGTLTKSDRLFFRYMTDAMKGGESLVDDFTAFLLALFEYDEPDRIIHRRKESAFVMCGAVVDATSNICVLTEYQKYLLLAQEAQDSTSGWNPEPRLIAEAIAAFYQNSWRFRVAGQPTVDSQTFPGIITIGTAPRFYRIPITMELVQCVQSGIRPPNTTIVQRCIPPVPNPGTYSREGIVPLANRGIVMQCFQAFKAFVGLEQVVE